MNKIQALFKTKKKNILNIYFTAGYPKINDTQKIINQLVKTDVDILEIGIPYSDPLADGNTIQESSKIALENGISLELVIGQLKESRKTTDIPIIIMGYYNQFLQYGMEKLIEKLSDIPVDGMIIPDLPMDYYEKHYKALFEMYNMSISFLVTPQTSSMRIKQADAMSTGFLYIVSQSSITGGQKNISDEQVNYFERLKSMHLSTSTLIGFGIYNNYTFVKASEYSNGAIIGSAFIRMLRDKGIDAIPEFVDNIRNEN